MFDLACDIDQVAIEGFREDRGNSLYRSTTKGSQDKIGNVSRQVKANEHNKESLIVLLIRDTATAKDSESLLTERLNKTIFEGSFIYWGARKEGQGKHIELYAPRQVKNVLICLKNINLGLIGIVNNKIEHEHQPVCLCVWLNLSDNALGFCHFDLAVEHLIENALTS